MMNIKGENRDGSECRRHDKSEAHKLEREVKQGCEGERKTLCFEGKKTSRRKENMYQED